MRKLFLLLPIILFLCPSAFAQGGGCPAGAPVTGNHCYFIAANGSDSNNGISEAAPWLHAPQMPNCSGNCAVAQNQSGGIPPGTGLIFRGGDTWHFGNPSASPYTGGVWNFNGGQGPNGTPANPIYIGVDQTWFTGGSWTRPILTADNPTEASLTGCTASSSGTSCLNRYVASCAYQIATGFNSFTNFGASRYYIFDNFEMTGLCVSQLNGAGQDTYISYNGMTGPMSILNIYVHGWTHVQFGDINNPLACTPSTVCTVLTIFGGGVLSLAGTAGETVRNVVIDGFDSDPRAISRFCYCGFYDVSNSVFRYGASILPRDIKVFHDNLIEFFYDNGHGNVLEVTGNHSGPLQAVYNNVTRNTPPSDWTIGFVGWWLEPMPGQTAYVFNNLEYNIGILQYQNIGQNAEARGNFNYFNNMFQDTYSGGVGILACQNLFGGTLTDISNHFITDGPVSACTHPTSTPLVQTNAQATSSGYTNSQTPYTYSPKLSSSPTVGTGTNKQDYCTTMLASSDPLIQAAGTACKSDTTYAVTYNASTHTVSGLARTANIRPSSGAWDLGPYQFIPGPPSDVITWTNAHQTIDGWGASTGYQQRNPNLTAAQADCFFLASGGSCASGNSIGLEWIRIQDNTVSSSAPDLPTLQLAVARGAKVFLSFNGPPLNSGDYASQATYMVGKIQYLQANGVTISAVGTQNEPLGNTTGAQFDTYIVSYLGPAMTTAGLGGIPIVLGEGAYWFADDFVTPCMNDTSCSPKVPIVAGHGYTSTPQTLYFAQDWAACCAVYPNNPPPAAASSKRVWMTEIEGGAAGPCASNAAAATYDAGMTDAMVWGRNIHDLFSANNGSAWMYWNLAGQTAHGLPGCNDGLTDTSINPAKRFYVVGNWSKFVRPGWVRIDAAANPQAGVFVSAFKEVSSAKYAIVALNTTGGALAQAFNLSGFPATTTVTPWITSSSFNLAAQSPAAVSAGAFSYSLPANSVTSFVGTGSLFICSIGVNPTSLSFGNQTINSSSGIQTITVTYTSIDTTCTSVSVAMQTGTQFSVANSAGSPCGATLAPGASCIVNVTFTPATAGAKSDNVVISSNIANVNVPVSGTGIDSSAIQQILSADCTPTPQNYPASCAAATAGTGHTLILVFESPNGYNTVTITGITDNATGGSNTWVQAAGARSTNTAGGGSTMADIWYAVNNKGGETSFTVATSAALRAFTRLYSIANVNALDQTCAGNSQTSSATPNTCSVTTLSNKEYAVAVIDEWAGVITGLNGGAWTLDSLLSGNGWAHLITSTTGTYSTQFNATSPSTFNTSVATFNAGGVIPPKQVVAPPSGVTVIPH